jgi:hypothetical protein
MLLYAYVPTAVTSEETPCPCVACRFGHGADHPARSRRYTTDMTDAEWQAIQPLMSWPTWLDGNGGRPGEYCRRQITDAIRYVVDNGCKWRNLSALAHRPCDLHPVDGKAAISSPPTTTCAKRSAKPKGVRPSPPVSSSFPAGG